MVQRRHPSKKMVRVISLFFGISLGTASALYFWSLYDQLSEAFFRRDQNTPTQIFSDVTRIEPGIPKKLVQEHLNRLGYSFEKRGHDLIFTLHPMNYPSFLIPEDHIQSQAESLEAELIFTPESPHPLNQILIHGQLVHDLYLEPELVATLARGSNSKEIRTNLKFEEIPSLTWKAIIAVEDQHFLEHKGLDPRGIGRAIWVNLKTLSFAQGGSTLTQQLVKNLTARRTKNIFRKINELFLSLLLEMRFTKEQILERYLNEVYLGQVGHLEIHGVAEGARYFFGKKLGDLTLSEVALMAGLIRGPGYYSPYRYRNRALERQKLVLKKMVEAELIAEDEAAAAIRAPIRFAPPQNVLTKAPFFTDYIKAELNELLRGKFQESEIPQAGLRVYTTLDLQLNTAAQRAVQQGVIQVAHRINPSLNQKLEGALASVDHQSGFIKALIGGQDYRESSFNRILNMKRQVGSTFKPVVYLAALLQGKDSLGVPYSPGYPIFDGPLTWNYDHGRQSWSPHNYEKGFKGWIDLRTSLSQSVNTTTARLASQVGLDSIIETAKKLGIKTTLQKFPALSLGVAELSPLELLEAYASLAQLGKKLALTSIRAVVHDDNTILLRSTPSTEQVLDAGAIELLNHVLGEVFTSGTAQAAKKLGFHIPAAGKTGTTNHHRDAWFAGFTSDYTTVVWVGSDQPTNQNHATPPFLTGANSALPIWVDYMKSAHQWSRKQTTEVSSQLVDVLIDTHTGKEASKDCPPQQVRLEKFIKGREPKLTSCETQWPTQPNEQITE